MTHPLDFVATRVFKEAIRTNRAGEILQHLFEGGGVTYSPTGELILMAPSDILSLLDGSDEA